MIKFECVTELSELQCLFPGEPFCDNVCYAAYKTEFGGNDFSLLFSLNGNICIIERIKSDKNEPSVATIGTVAEKYSAKLRDDAATLTQRCRYKIRASRDGRREHILLPPGCSVVVANFENF